MELTNKILDTALLSELAYLKIRVRTRLTTFRNN